MYIETSVCIIVGCPFQTTNVIYTDALGSLAIAVQPLDAHAFTGSNISEERCCVASCHAQALRGCPNSPAPPLPPPPLAMLHSPLTSALTATRGPTLTLHLLPKQTCVCRRHALSAARHRAAFCRVRALRECLRRLAPPLLLPPDPTKPPPTPAHSITH